MSEMHEHPCAIDTLLVCDQLFSGVKMALLSGTRLLTYQRDDKPGLRFAGQWDLPGGGREGNESPFDCIARELQEECCLSLTRGQIRWARVYGGQSAPQLRQYFLVAVATPAQVETARFGEEGHDWHWMDVNAYVAHPNAVGPLRQRVADYLSAHSFNASA